MPLRCIRQLDYWTLALNACQDSTRQVLLRQRPVRLLPMMGALVRLLQADSILL